MEDHGKFPLDSLHGERMLHLVVDEVGVVHVGAEGYRAFRVERAERRLRPAEEVLDRLGVVKCMNAPLLMAGEETVVGNHDGKTDVRMLADSHRGEVQVVGGLGIPGQQNDPARVEGEIDVGVVAPNVERAGDRPAGDVEDHRNPRTGLHGKLFQAVEQALGRGRVEHPAAAEGGPVADAGGAVLPVPRDHDDVVLPVGLHLGEGFRDFGRRRDRIVAHHVEADVSRGKGRGLVTASEIGTLPGDGFFHGLQGHELLPISSKSGTQSWSASPGVSASF